MFYQTPIRTILLSRRTLEAGDIAGNVLVYYEAEASVTSVAALVVKGVTTCVECKATLFLPSCFTNTDDVELYPGYLVFKLCDSDIRGERSRVIRAYLRFPMAACSNPAILRTLCSVVIISAAHMITILITTIV